MPRRSRKNWPLRIALGLALILLAAYIAWPLVSRPVETADPIAWEGPAERVRQRVIATLTGIWFFVLGATIGSFLNVVAHRLPLGVTLVSQPSRCPYCHRPILFRHNVPILGWLILRGRCRVCRLPISPRYPLVELLVACIFFSLFCVELAFGGANLPVRTPGRPGVMWNVLSPNGDLIAIYLYHCFLMSVMVVCALLRVDKHTIPRRLLAIVGVVGLGMPLVWPPVSVVPWTAARPAWLGYGPPWAHLETPVAGTVVGLLVGSFMRSLARVQPPRTRHEDSSYRREPIAGFALIGMFLGWQAVVPTFLVTASIHFMTRTVMRLFDRRDRDHLWSTHAVFGTWLVLCIWRPMSSFGWAPGAHSSPVVHGFWLVASLALVKASLFPRN